MTLPRRKLLCAAASAAATLAAPAIFRSQALAQTVLEPTRTMRGGNNNYVPNAPIVDRLGTGFFTQGRVVLAGGGEPLEGIRIQIWAATTIGGEREPLNHGSVLTDADGWYSMEMHQIVPSFGQPHGHLAYDDGRYQTVFLRPRMASAAETSIRADFVLAPA